MIIKKLLLKKNQTKNFNFQKIDSACFAKNDIRLLASCSQTLLTSPKNTTSSSRSRGIETMTSSASSTLVTNSTTPTTGSETLSQSESGEFGNRGLEREFGKSEFGRSGLAGGFGKSGLDGGLGKSGLDGEFGKSGLDGEFGKSGLDGEFGKSGLDGEDERDEGELTQFSRRPGRADRLSKDGVGDHKQEDKISVRDANTSSVSMSTEKPFSLSAREVSGMSESDSESFIASEISLRAKLAGSIGMTIALVPVLTGVDSKGTVTDRLNVSTTDTLKLTDSAIPSESLEKNKNKIEKQENAVLSGNKNCSTSTNLFANIF